MDSGREQSRDLRQLPWAKRRRKWWPVPWWWLVFVGFTLGLAARPVVDVWLYWL